MVLTPEAGGYADPVYSPDGSRLAFTRRNGGEEAVWVADTDGANATQRSPLAGNVQDPNWSPDSRTIAFALQTGGPPNIWSAPAAGGGAERLLDWIAWEPQYSPDGSQFLFGAFRNNSPGNWLMPATGGEPAPLFPNSSEFGGGARWSPDGTRVAMTVVGDAQRVVGMFQPDGMAMTHLTAEGYEEFREWSPDGAAMVYTSNRTGLRDVWVMPATGGEPRQLTQDIRDDWGPT
jgi:TolB protein